MEKEQKKSGNGLKVATILLALVLTGSLGYIYYISSEANKTEKKLKSEKEDLRDELETMQTDLQDAIDNGTELSDELQAKKDEIDQLIADLENAEGDLKRFKNEAYRLRRANKKLLAQNDVLKQENTKLSSEIDSTNVVLNTAQQLNDTLSTQLNTTLEKASRLVVMNTKATSYKVKSSGKEVPTTKASKVDRITVCYNIPENNVAEEQEKIYFVQVIDTRNNVLGEKKTVNFGDQSLTYSVESTVQYKNKTVTICESINNKEGFPKGIYAVNVYDQNELVSSSSISLK